MSKVRTIINETDITHQSGGGGGSYTAGEGIEIVNNEISTLVDYESIETNNDNQLQVKLKSNGYIEKDSNGLLINIPLDTTFVNGVRLKWLANGKLGLEDNSNFMTYNGTVYQLVENIDPAVLKHETMGDWNLPLKDGTSITVDSSKLTALTIKSVKESATAIPSNFLSECTNLTSIDLSAFDKITSIGGSFLSDCERLTSVNMSNMTSLTSISTYFLANCEVLSSLYLPDRNPPTAQTNGFLFRVSSTCKYYARNDLVDTYKTTSPWSTKSSNIISK